MKNPRSTGPPQLEANPLERLLSDANSLQLDSGNSSPDQTAELRAEEVNSAELSPRTPSSEAPEEGAANSLQLDSGNSSPDQAPGLGAEESSPAGLTPGRLTLKLRREIPKAPNSLRRYLARRRSRVSSIRLLVAEFHFPQRSASLLAIHC